MFTANRAVPTAADTNRLLALAGDTSTKGREVFVERFSKTFLRKGVACSENEATLMADIVRHLMGDLETNLRRTLADQLEKLTPPPAPLLELLASDELGVSESLLQNCPFLTDKALIHIVRHRSSEHQLAISIRKNLPESVSDVLVEVGNEQVVNALLRNPDAHLSKKAMAYIVEQSKRIDSYQNPLLTREELTPDLAARLYTWLADELKTKLIERFPTITENINTAAATASITPSNAAAHVQLVSELAANGQLSAELLIQTLKEGEIPLFEAMFARLLELKLEQAQNLLLDNQGQMLAIAAKALCLTKEQYLLLFDCLQQSKPKNQRCSQTDRQKCFLYFQRQNTESATAVLKAWQRHEGASHA
jgi:uncharacterized protein (DUF2336 family)